MKSYLDMSDSELLEEIIDLGADLLADFGDIPSHSKRAHDYYLKVCNEARSRKLNLNSIFGENCECVNNVHGIRCCQVNQCEYVDNFCIHCGQPHVSAAVVDTLPLRSKETKSLCE